MIAGFPMYDRPELQRAQNALWENIRKFLGYGPKKLRKPENLWDFWQSEHLLLGQTCGYPYRANLHSQVNYVATPDYGLPDCQPGYYNSVFLCHKSNDWNTIHDLTNHFSFTYNEAMSQSGWAAPIHHLHELSVHPVKVIESGAHLNSIEFIKQKHADVCAIDAQAWRLVQRYDDGIDTLKVLGKTAPTPALPLICATQFDPDEIYYALCDALNALSPQFITELGIRSFQKISVEQYLSVPTPPSPTDLTT